MQCLLPSTLNAASEYLCFGNFKDAASIQTSDKKLILKKKINTCILKKGCFYAYKLSFSFKPAHTHASHGSVQV